MIWINKTLIPKFYRIFDLPYQSQTVPLAAILADIGDAWEHQAIRQNLIT